MHCMHFRRLTSQGCTCHRTQYIDQLIEVAHCSCHAFSIVLCRLASLAHAMHCSYTNICCAPADSPGLGCNTEQEGRKGPDASHHACFPCIQCRLQSQPEVCGMTTQATSWLVRLVMPCSLCTANTCGTTCSHSLMLSMQHEPHVHPPTPCMLHCLPAVHYGC